MMTCLSFLYNRAQKNTATLWEHRCAITVDGVFLKADREMKKVFYELNEEKL